MIPDLPKTYVDHVVDPRGLGDVEEPNAAGEVGSMVGGFGVRISLAYGAADDKGAVIERARGRIFGNAGLLGPVAWLTQAVEGQTYDEACGHDADSIMRALCEGNGHTLPPSVERGAEFAVKALRRALGIAVNGTPADIDSGILVCRCIGVGDRTIRRAIRAGALDPEAIGEATGACTGCRSCRPDLLALIDEELRAQLPVPDEALHPVARICMAAAGPVLRGLGLPLDGASVEEGLIDQGYQQGAVAEAGIVRIRLGAPEPGACVSPQGAVAITRQLLRDTVAEAIHVTLER